MAKIIVNGGKELSGTIKISGSKNAALPIMTASLLTEGDLELSNVPNLSDVTIMRELLQSLGTNISLNKKPRSLKLTTKVIGNYTADYEIVRKMRASIIVLGPILARSKIAKVALPGGCSIGSRPIDLHLKGMEAMGAKIYMDGGYVFAEAVNGLRGAEVKFPIVSVGATENVILAATLADGKTTIFNAAREPEIVDLCQCLQKMGANIKGAGTEIITIKGVPKLNGTCHSVIADRIELGTFMLAPALTGGEIFLEGENLKAISYFHENIKALGLNVSESKDGIRVQKGEKKLNNINISTDPFPGFPTDLQPQLMAALGLADGQSTIIEAIFENRFMHAPELNRMGANIQIRGKEAIIRGVSEYRGVPVLASDLRAAASLILAGLAAKGKTIIEGVHHLDRGYEQMEEKLALCGADIYRSGDN